MSKKMDKGLEEIKCPPQRVPWSNLNEEWASRRPATSHNHKHHYKHEYQDEEAIAMEEGFPFEEKEEIKGANNPQNLVAKKGIGIEYPDMSGGQRVVSLSRRPDVSPGEEALGSQVHHPAEGRQIQERIFPGAFREGGLEDEDEDEEDERTIQSRTEPPVPPTLSAELVNVEEEERHRQDDINQALQKALQRERQLVQDQINQALQREHQQAVLAEVVPEVISKRDRRWKFAGGFLLLVLSAVGVVLGITLRPDPDPDPETFIPQDLIDFLSNASSDSGKALRNSSTPQHEALKWLANQANLTNYTGQEKIQRYALATLYYSTKGNSWTRSDNWLSNGDVCGQWYQYNNTTIKCTSAGAVSSLSLHNNNLIGMLPAEIGMLSDSLVGLYLGLNELGGTLPNEIASLTKLTNLDLWGNVYIGTLPSVIGLLTNLQSLELDENELDGAVPSELGLLSNLESLGLYSNGFTGTIPSEIGRLTKLESFLYLDDNNLMGTIPTELGLLSNLEWLDLSSNRLIGTVPTSLASLSLLKWLYLYENVLNGTIPTELGLLSNLELLDLSSNRLTGTVPTSLASLPLLKELYLSDNDLTGSLDAFCGIDYDDFAANTCGQEEIVCACCTYCCDPGVGFCEPL